MLENLRISIQGIWSHKMRSFLTMLGIIIGIAAIIAIVSTIKGTNEQIKEELIGSGNNTVKVTLYDGDNTYDAGYSSSSLTPQLSEDQKERVFELENVENATFYYNRSYSSNIYYMDTSLSGGGVYGIDLNYLSTCGYVVKLGRGFIQDDYDHYKKVALVDDNASENLFGNEGAIGKTIEIGSEPFVVVGVVAQEESYQPTISNLTDYYDYYESAIGTVMIPTSCWPIVYQFDEPYNCIVKAVSTDAMTSAGTDTADILNEAVASTTNYKYKADDVMETVRQMQKLSESTNNQLIWIASISLLVGGIGVMNIMLVSVTERTKEIGLKKAIGARKRTILWQFLTEAAMLTSLGGAIGVATGIVLSKVVSRVTDTPSAISIPAIILAVVFSMFIGIVFGLLPSVKAANLNPIDALRSE